MSEEINSVKKVIDVMKMLDSEEMRANLLISLCESPSHELSDEDCTTIIKDMIFNYFNDCRSDLADYLKSFDHEPPKQLCVSMMPILKEMILISTKEGCNDTHMIKFFDTFIYYIESIIESRNYGEAAQDLLELFCQRTSTEVLIAINQKYENLDIVKEKILDIIADELIEKEGPRKVWLAYWNLTHGKSLATNKKAKADPEEIKKKIVEIGYNTSEADIIQKRSDLLHELGNIIGTEEAKKWVGQEFPQLNNE